MIPVSRPELGQRELENVQECLRSGWISSQGGFLERFEAGWAAFCGMRHGVAVTSGTAALQLSVACLGLEREDEIVMPTFTIISCALAAIYNGLVPVLVDADPETWCMDVAQVEEKITSRTKAVMAVHIYGHPVDMDPLKEVASRHDLVLMEDSAEAHGAEYMGRRCGGLGDVSCFSFYANKIVTTGEGGMVLTDDDEYADRLRVARNLCFGKEERFRHSGLGFNFRMTNVQAAIGLGQLERIDETIQKKRHIAGAYGELLKDLPIRLPVERPGIKNVYWMYGIVLEPSSGQDGPELANRLMDAGIETRPFFLGMHEQPALLSRGLFAGESFPVAENLARRGIYLPSGPNLSDEEIGAVGAAVRRALQ
jgi:perosamine synthetase